MPNVGSALLDGVNTAGGIYAPMGGFDAADWYVAESRNEGWYVGQGCQVVASGTAGKVDMSAGIVLVGQYEVNVAAVTAFATTITTLASGLSAGQALWAALEVDIAGTLNVNAGSAAQSDATHSPVKPTPTSARVVVAWLFVPFGATAVDELLSSSNTKAKIMKAQQLVPGESPTGWQYEQGTLVYGTASSTTFGLLGIATDKTATYRATTKISWNDGTNVPGFGVVSNSVVSPATSAVSSTIATSRFTKASHGYNSLGFSCVVASGFAATTGITNGQLYWVNYIDANTFQLALTWTGTAITLGGTTQSDLAFTPGTSIFLIQQSDFYPRNATITKPRYSYAETPQGWTGWFNYTPTLTGWSSAPTSAVYRWTIHGNDIHVHIDQIVGGQGTSNTTGMTITLPIANVAASYAGAVPFTIINNSAAITVAGRALAAGGSADLTCNTTMGTGAWTASGGKGVLVDVLYKYA